MSAFSRPLNNPQLLEKIMLAVVSGKNAIPLTQSKEDWALATVELSIALLEQYEYVIDIHTAESKARTAACYADNSYNYEGED